jgi:hypothetical protein
VCFLRAKGLSAKDIHKENFLVYSGKCLSHKAIQSWVEKFSQGRSKVADDTPPNAEVAVTTIRRLLCWRFRRTGKAMSDMSRNKCFSGFEYHMFYVLYPFVTYLLTLPRIILEF